MAREGLPAGLECRGRGARRRQRARRRPRAIRWNLWVFHLSSGRIGQCRRNEPRAGLEPECERRSRHRLVEDQLRRQPRSSEREKFDLDEETRSRSRAASAMPSGSWRAVSGRIGRSVSTGESTPPPSATPGSPRRSGAGRRIQHLPVSRVRNAAVRLAVSRLASSTRATRRSRCSIKLRETHWRHELSADLDTTSAVGLAPGRHRVVAVTRTICSKYRLEVDGEVSVRVDARPVVRGRRIGLAHPRPDVAARGAMPRRRKCCCAPRAPERLRVRLLDRCAATASGRCSTTS